MTFHRLGAVAPHPRGIGALFTSSQYDPSTNTVKTRLSFVSFKNSQVTALTDNGASEPFWLSPTLFGVLKDVNGTQQVIDL